MAWWKHLKKDNAEKNEKLRNEIEKEGGLKRRELFAMILSAFVVFIPAALVVLLVLAAVILIPLCFL